MNSLARGPGILDGCELLFIKLFLRAAARDSLWICSVCMRVVVRCLASLRSSYSAGSACSSSGFFVDLLGVHASCGAMSCLPSIILPGGLWIRIANGLIPSSGYFTSGLASMSELGPKAYHDLSKRGRGLEAIGIREESIRQAGGSTITGIKEGTPTWVN